MADTERKELLFLTPEQANKIWQAINLARQTDDRDPYEVIITTYHGDENKYLSDMAKWLNVRLD